MSGTKRAPTPATRSGDFELMARPEPAPRIHNDGHVIKECSPRYSTPRRPDRRSLGGLACQVAEWLGCPLMPWQVDIVFVILEYEYDRNGDIMFFYDSWFYTVPRQQGKTLLAFVWMITRCLTTRGGNFAWTAQNASKAGGKWKKELFPLFRASKDLSALGRCYESQGREKIVFKNGSVMAIAGSKGDDSHGDTLNGAGCDEIWAIDSEILSGLNHALSRPDSQMGKFSTAGDEHSEFYDAEVDAGRSAALTDAGHGEAYFEYSGESGLDPHDLEACYDFMPALGHRTSMRLLESKLRDAIKHDKLADFARAYHNVPDTSLHHSLFDAGAYEAAVGPWGKKKLKKAKGVALALHVNYDRTRSVVSIALDGRYVGVVEVFDSTAGVAKACNSLTKKYGCEVWVAAAGPAAAIKGLRRRRKMKGDEVQNACAAFLDAINNGDVTIRPHGTIDEAMSEARKRKSGSRWVWPDTEQAAALWSITLALAGSHEARIEARDAEPSASSIYGESDFELIVF